MMKTKKLINYLAMVAFMFSYIGANTKCMCIFHDPEKPEQLKKLKNY